MEAPEGSAWARMWHLYADRTEEFLDHYHQRSNVETVFAMVKAKFGDGLHGRTPVAQDNEVYAKFIAHNLCVSSRASTSSTSRPTSRQRTVGLATLG